MNTEVHLSEEVLKDAKKYLDERLQQGDSIDPNEIILLPSSEEAVAAILTRNPALIIALTSIKYKKTIYYIGVPKPN